MKVKFFKTTEIMFLAKWTLYLTIPVFSNNNPDVLVGSRYCVFK